ncbi:Uncharacterised protein (plasmid) [Tsukamurella tyrosinosolvens]|uniref:Uncharacterized protein n=1 Tax=Tsukamurella tyrosinosolvens TaxID=57704 RepID=A0A1H4QQ09_TSUTY|nr:hypothetical protein SAMN04489793_1815 [Tsukamurella tyrosinosolvens]VEH92519.1 Uncharacterised protein [Tsukamurella tyrosinosolvens]
MTDDYRNLADQLGDHMRPEDRRGPAAHRSYGRFQNEWDATRFSDTRHRVMSRRTTSLEDALLELHGYTLEPGQTSRVENRYLGNIREQRFPFHTAPEEATSNDD